MESILKDTLCFLDAIPQIDYEDLVSEYIITFINIFNYFEREVL
jgi:hypothetical protein